MWQILRPQTAFCMDVISVNLGQYFKVGSELLEIWTSTWNWCKAVAFQIIRQGGYAGLYVKSYITAFWFCYWWQNKTNLILNTTDINPKTSGGVNLTLRYSFPKNVSSKERVKPWFFVTFNIIISCIFPEHFIDIPQVVLELWRIFLSISAIFIHQFLSIFWIFVKISLLQRN